MEYIFTSNGDGTLSIYHEKSADTFELMANIPTKRGARTIAVDDQTETEIRLLFGDVSDGNFGRRIFGFIARQSHHDVRPRDQSVRIPHGGVQSRRSA